LRQGHQPICQESYILLEQDTKGNIDFTFIFHVLDGTTSKITFDKPRQTCPENKNRKKKTSQCPPVIINHLGSRQQRKTLVLGFKLPHAS
jgi:hypothetical protein